MKLDIFTWDNLWHFLGGMAITASLWFLGGLVGLPGDWIGFSLVLGAGITREYLQHKHHTPIWTPHRVTEGVMWAVGGFPILFI